MVKMVPDVISPEIKSDAEKKLFAQFRSYETSENIVILHSLGVSEHSKNIFGEIDFLIICEEGFLCVEVKGGAVERENGIWSFTNRYGKIEKKKTGPFEQAQGNSQSLRQYLAKKLGHGHPFCRAQHASCVLMPDCRFDFEGIDIIPEVLFDRDTGCDLNSIIRASFAYWRDECEKKHGFRGEMLTGSQMNEAVELLRGDFRFVPSLKDTVLRTYEALVSLTDEQYGILEALEENPRLLVSGVAGTGKTLLAVEQCKRACLCGKTVLYLCFNRNIAQFVRSQFKREDINVDAYTIHSIMERECGDRDDEHDSTFFTQVLPQRFIEKGGRVRPYDLVVIDEGQDLINGLYLQCLELLVRDGMRGGSWTLFYDPNQNIYNAESDMKMQLPKLKKWAVSYSLTLNCRNTKEIANANTLLTNIPQAGRIKTTGPKVEQIPYTSAEDEWEQILSSIRALRDGGIRNQDIVILSSYSKNNRQCVLHSRQIPSSLGVLKTEEPIWKASSDEIRFSSAAAYKGLESKVILYTDVDRFSETSRRLLNYVAISRAEVMLFIFYDQKAEEERQKMLVTGYAELK